MTALGWIGLGHMGTPMAMNLLQAGHRVNAYNRSRDKAAPLADSGAAVLGSPREIVEQSDIVFIMLSDSHAIRSVLTQADGVLEAVTQGKVIVNMSTIAPEDSVAFAKLVSEGGGQYVDAPVSGSVGAAKAGQLVILAGGEKAAIDACQPYFDILGDFKISPEQPLLSTEKGYVRRRRIPRRIHGRTDVQGLGAGKG